MPWKPARPCCHPGCTLLTYDRFCPAHAEEYRKRVDQKRGTAAQRGYGSRWQKARIGFLKTHPLCECSECQGGKVRVMAATVVDHIQPHRGDQKLFWVKSNWMAMAKECHDRKTARDDGGFGNRRTS